MPRAPAQARRALEETCAEASKNPSERQMSLESLAEGCAPRMVILQNCQSDLYRLPVNLSGKNFG